MRKLFSVAVLAAIWSLVPGIVSAQTPTFQRGQSVTVLFDHGDQTNTEFYYHVTTGPGVNVQSTQMPLSIVQGGVGSFSYTMPNVTGTFAIVVRAANTDVYTDSDALAFIVGKGQPAKPGKPRTQSQTSIRGTMQDFARNVERQQKPEPVVVYLSQLFAE